MRLWIVLATSVLLTACTSSSDPTRDVRSMEGDMLPSELSLAYQRVDTRLAYPDARLEYDPRGCAMYSARGPADQPYTELLTTRAGEQICPGR